MPKETGRETAGGNAGPAAAAALPVAAATAPEAAAGLPPNHPPVGEMGTAPAGGLETASGPSLAWSAPAGWQSKPASMMRKATYVITGPDGATAELAVTAFPGDVGGDIANVNRWRGQVGLAPLSDAAAAASIERLNANGLAIGVVDVVDRTAPNPPHLIGAMVPYDGATWFFKLVGPDAVVAAQRTAFDQFIKTVKAAAPTTP